LNYKASLILDIIELSFRPLNYKAYLILDIIVVGGKAYLSRKHLIVTNFLGHNVDEHCMWSIRLFSVIIVRH